MFRSLFPRDVFAELDRLQRELQQSFDVTPSIRGIGRGGYPALNVGGRPSRSRSTRSPRDSTRRRSR